MNEAIYQARQELFRELQFPISRAEIRRLRHRQRIKLAAWEGMLAATLAVKRLLDVAASAAALVLLSPFFLLVSLAIVLEDWGPVLYVQERVGLNGRVFRFYKFRSMIVNADKIRDRIMSQNESSGGVIFKMRRDPRVTRVGRILRRFSIDEAPQLFNVLIGDLSLVGPRPPLPREVAQYTLEERKRLHVKPGLTCFWQIEGRSDIPFQQQVRLDLQYIHSRSLWTDLKIMLRTVPAVLSGRGAY